MLYVFIIAIMAVLAILNAIVPLPGFNFFVPLFGTFMSTEEAITFITVYFLMNSSIIVYVFREYLRKDMVKILLPSSFVGAVAGGILSSSLNELWLTILVLCFVLYFFFKKLRRAIASDDKVTQKHGRKSTLAIGTLSGFLQGGGFGGGDIRNSYLYAKNLSLQQVRATTAAVGVSIFVVSLTTRAVNGSFHLGHIWLYALLIPIAIVSAYVGRHLTTRLSKSVQIRIVLALMVMSLALLLNKIVHLI